MYGIFAYIGVAFQRGLFGAAIPVPWSVWERFKEIKAPKVFRSPTSRFVIFFSLTLAI